MAFLAIKTKYICCYNWQPMDAYSKKLERKVTFLKTYHPFTSGKLLQE